MGMKEFHSNVADDIRRHGRSVVCVGKCEEDGTPSFAYTIGNWPRFPELLIIGTLDGRVLNTLSEMMIERCAAFNDSELVNLDGKHSVKIINADQRAQDQFTIQAGQHFGHENYRVLQALIPDCGGHFPDEPECQPPYSTIPVLKPQ